MSDISVANDRPAGKVGPRPEVNFPATAAKVRERFHGDYSSVAERRGALLGRVNEAGWRPFASEGRNARDPSESFKPDTGAYRDFGSPKLGSRPSFNVFEFVALKARGSPDEEAGILILAAECGVETVYLHGAKRQEGRRSAAPPPPPKPKPKPPPPDLRGRDYWERRHRLNVERLARMERLAPRRPSLLHGAAKELGVPAKVLLALGVGEHPENQGLRWHAAAYAPDCTMSRPMRDCLGRVVGLNLHCWEPSLVEGEGLKEKQHAKGSRPGLFFLHTEREWSGPVLVPEGFSDVAALTAGRLPAVGRSTGHCNADVEELAGFFDRHPGAFPLFCVENDRKLGGDHPGNRLTRACAQEVADRLGRHVYVYVNPDGKKDAREWFKARGLNHRSTDEEWAAAAEAYYGAIKTEAVHPRPEAPRASAVAAPASSAAAPAYPATPPRWHRYPRLLRGLPPPPRWYRKSCRKRVCPLLRGEKMMSDEVAFAHFCKDCERVGCTYCGLWVGLAALQHDWGLFGGLPPGHMVYVGDVPYARQKKGVRLDAGARQRLNAWKRLTRRLHNEGAHFLHFPSADGTSTRLFATRPWGGGEAALTPEEARAAVVPLCVPPDGPHTIKRPFQYSACWELPPKPGRGEEEGEDDEEEFVWCRVGVSRASVAAARRVFQRHRGRVTVTQRGSLFVQFPGDDYPACGEEALLDELQRAGRAELEQERRAAADSDPWGPPDSG
jgi:hypothetical protein